MKVLKCCPGEIIRCTPAGRPSSVQSICDFFSNQQTPSEGELAWGGWSEGGGRVNMNTGSSDSSLRLFFRPLVRIDHFVELILPSKKVKAIKVTVK